MASPAVVKMSYVPNFALIDWGNPSNFFPPNPERVVKTLAAVEYPAETAAFYDGTHSLPDKYLDIMDIPIQVRHTGTVNVAWARWSREKYQGHVPSPMAAQHRWVVNAPDGKAFSYWQVTSDGPYKDKLGTARCAVQEGPTVRGT